MKKILVPVDFSANSRKAIRFAIQFASQTNAEIIFFHVVNVMLSTVDGSWDAIYYTQFQGDELKRSEKYLDKLIKKVYNKKLPPRVGYKCACQIGNDTSDEIIAYAKMEKADFICIGATGTGFIGKLFGTVATNLIVNSQIPVFVVPKNYRHKTLADICYSSDMDQPEPEIRKVLHLAAELQAMVGVVHFDYEIGLKENSPKLTEIAQKFKNDNIRFTYKELNALHPLNDHLRKFVIQTKPSLLVLFTKPNRNWFDRLLIPSSSAGMSFGAKVPLLVYRKN